MFIIDKKHLPCRQCFFYIIYICVKYEYELDDDSAVDFDWIILLNIYALFGFNHLFCF